MRVQWIVALFTVLLALPARAGPGAGGEPGDRGFEAERAAAVKELVSGLESYAEWSTSKKLWLERDRALEGILAIDPGNLSAKRGLAWQQVADGVWEPPKEKKPTKNYDLAALKEAPAHYTEAIRPWRDHLLRLLEEHRAELTSVQRDSALEEILAVDPEDEQVRAANGEVRGAKGWVLAETARAKARRAEIRNIVKDALAAVPKIEDIATNAIDQSFKVDWKASLGTDRVHVLTTGARAEAERAAAVLHATREVFNKVFGTAADLHERFTVYLLCDPASKATFIENVGGLTPAQRLFYSQVSGTGLNGSNSAAWWAEEPERRLDGITRHTLGARLISEFNVSTDVAWAWEGLGLYLTREMIGTRMTWYISPAKESETSATKKTGTDWMKKLLTPGTNWMNEGYRLVRAGDAVGLAGSMLRPLNRMSPQDLFLSYVVAAYLLETESERLPGLLRALAGSKGRPAQSLPQAWQSVFSTELGSLAPRLERWLGERR